MVQFHIDVPEDKIDQVQAALDPHGINLEQPKKAGPAKAQHRWRKDISATKFHIDYLGAKGTVIWQKPTEMRLLAGAKMLPDQDAPRVADGSLGFTARFALTLREENSGAYNHQTYVTTKDIILRSVNEVGHFLYFAGTNSWLHMVDDQGQTIDQLTVVAPK